MSILRQDLTLSRADADADGAPSWILHDPAQNRFFRLGPVEVEFLHANTVDQAELASSASGRLGRTIQPVEAVAFLAFLKKNNLLRATGDAERKRLLDARNAARPPFAHWLIKNYLSVRIPILRPDRFLDATIGYLNWWFDPRLKWFMLGIGFIGLILVGLRWDQFLATAVDYFTPRGLVAYAFAITLIKAVHEFGHAYTVKYYGGRVPVIGISFIVFWPVLYTDTNDAWRFSRQARVEVDAAGMKAELTVAILALLMWLFLPDSTIRGLAFLACTTSLFLTFLINLNPLMRFDGYYLLSDGLGIENLQERAAAMARWRLRELLFGLQEPPPERPNFWFVAFAIASWIYRLTLTLSIAAFIYAFFFKLLGAALFLLQIWTYVVKPAWREIAGLKEFWPRIRQSRRFAVTAGILGLGILALLLPIRTTVSFPGQIQSANAVPVYATLAGEVKQIAARSFDNVKADTALVTLLSPDMDFEQQQVDANIAVLRWQMEVQSVEAPWLRQSLVTEANLRSMLERRESLRHRAEQTSLVVQDDAKVVDMIPDLQQGQWIGEGEFIARTIDAGVWEVEGYVEEGDLSLIVEGMTGYFFFSDGMHTRRYLKVLEVSPTSTKDMAASPLLSVFGGPLLSRQATGADSYFLTAAYYRVRLLAEAGPDGGFPQKLPGRVVLITHPSAALAGFYRRAVQFLRRESNF